MRYVKVAPRFRVVEAQPDGVFLEWITENGDIIEFLEVGLNWHSVGALRKALNQSPVVWRNNDDTLRISDAGSDLRLSFRVLSGTDTWLDLVLAAPEAAQFLATLADMTP
ncbi:MAG: hypothetical protein Q8L64_01350 [bacterium]|nr:hypothetical protein [bacterium]